MNAPFPAVLDPGLKGIVLFLGDPVLTDSAARELLNGLLSEQRRQLDLEVIRIPEQSVLRATESLRQVGMLGSSRCVWLRGLGEEPEAERVSLLEFLHGELPPGSLVVATSRKLDARSRLYKWFAGNGKVVDRRVEKDRRGRFEPERLIEVVARRIKDNGLPLPSRDVLAAIAARAGTELGLLLQEIDKLCLACADGEAPSMELVRAQVHDQAEAWVYDLTDAISRGDTAAAQEILEQLLAQGEAPLRLLGALAFHVGNLIEGSRLLHMLPPGALQRRSFDFARAVYPHLPEELRKRFPSALRAYHVLRAAARFPAGRLHRLHSDLLCLDMKLKRSRVRPIHLLSEFVQAASLAAR